MISKQCEEALDYIHRWSEEATSRGKTFHLESARAGFKIMPRPAEVLEQVTFRIHDLLAEWVCAPGVDPDLRLLYLHGGGYVMGDLDTTAPFAQLISRATGCSVLIIDYRLAPENPFPRALEDSLLAFRWLRNHGPQGPAPVRKIFIAGDSAGGGLALSTLLKLRDNRESFPECAVTISAFTDLTLSGESLKSRIHVDPVLSVPFLRLCSDAYSAETDRKNPYLSPLFSEPANLPPLFMQVGDREILLDDTVRFARKAESRGVRVTLDVWPEMFHSWQLFAPQVPEAEEALTRLGDFIKGFH